MARTRAAAAGGFAAPMLVMMRTPRRRALGQHGVHALVEQRIESGVGVRRLRLLRQRDRPLGQALEDEDVEIAALDELDGRLDAVAGIAGAAADAQRPRASQPEAPRRAWPRPSSRASRRREAGR